MAYDVIILAFVLMDNHVHFILYGTFEECNRFMHEYVAYETVERLFRTIKGFHYFFCRSREEVVDARGGMISRLSLPDAEMRQHKNEVCSELFGTTHTRQLTTSQRLRLARTLKARFNSSTKQIARLCGLVYDEVKDIL